MSRLVFTMTAVVVRALDCIDFHSIDVVVYPGLEQS